MRRNFAVLLSLSAALFLSACSTIDIETLPAGTLSGSLFVMWVDEGGPSGDGTFLYVPDPQDPLVFRRADQQAPGRIIQPGLMYTDGGSIPKIAQVFKGLSPWGYAPAYMIHDWMFVAHHCIVDGEDEERFAQVRDVDFENSAKILGEAIQTLIHEGRVDPNDVAANAITGAVGSVIARQLWDKRGVCGALRVKPKDVAAAEAAIPGSAKARTLRTFRLPQAEAPPAAPGNAARIVSRMSF